MNPTELIRQARRDLDALEVEPNPTRQLDKVDALRATVQALHLQVWHQYHTSGKGPSHVS